MTEHAVNNGTSICQTAQATHLILTFQDFCAEKTVGFTYTGKRAELEFHLVSDPEPEEIQMLLYVRNISRRLWHILTYEDPFNINTDTDIKVLPPNEDVYLYPLREFAFGNRDELIIYFRFDREAEMLQSPEINQEQLEQLWRRLQSLLQDSAFADMTVNGLPAHRAVMAAASGSLHETISNLISNNKNRSEDSTTQDPMIYKQSSQDNNVDIENHKVEPIEGGHLNDDYPHHCNKEKWTSNNCFDINRDVKTNIEGPFEGNRIKDDQIAVFEKITEDTKEYIEKKNIQDSADPQINEDIAEKESTSGLTSDSDIISGKSSKSVNTAISEVRKNNVLVPKETVDDIKESRRTRDKKLQLLDLAKEFIGNQSIEQFPVEEMCSMVKNFLAEPVDKHEEDIEILERPLPDNYQLEITELCNNGSTHEFLTYIYTNSFIDLCNKMGTIGVLLAVARLFDLENLKTDVQLEISLDIAATEALISQIVNLVKLYDLYTVKLKVISRCRWFFEYYSKEQLSHVTYLLTMPSQHRYQKQCVLTCKVKNISKMNVVVNSNVFFICGIPLQLSLGKIPVNTNNINELCIKISFQGKNNVDVPLLWRILLISTKYNRIVTVPKVGTWYPIMGDRQILLDPAYIVDDSVELRIYVKLNDFLQME